MLNPPPSPARASSAAYSSELHPEPRLRAVVLVAGGLAVLFGVVLLVGLRTDALNRIAAVIVWGLLSGREFGALRAGHARYSALRIDGSGAVELKTRHDEWQPAQLLPGCVVLPTLAWFRIETADGLRYAELLRGNSLENQQWRRLQVIWRHVGTTS